MKALFSNPKILAIAIIGLAALLVSFAGGALGAAFGGGFLGGPIPEIQLPAEKVVGLGSYDVTNTSIMLWAAGLLLVVISWLATRRMREVPTGLQNVFEVIVEFFDSTADSVAGGARHAGRRFLPLVLVIFLVVLVANWLGTLPGVGTIGRIEPVEEWVEHRIHDKEVEIEEMRNEEGLSHLSEDELEEQALRAVLEEHAAREFVVFNGNGGFGIIPFGRGEDAKVALRDVVDIESDDIHHIEGDLHASLVKRAPVDPDDPGKHSDLVGSRAGLIVPFFRGASTDLNTTLAIAIVAMVAVQIWGIRSLGLRRYSGKFIVLNKGPINAFGHPPFSRDELEEHALKAVLEEHAGRKFVVFNGSGGFGTVPVGRGEDSKVALRDVVDIESDDIHHIEDDLHASVVKRAPVDPDNPGKHSSLVGKRAGLLVPFFRGASTDLNTTLAIAIVAMISVQIWGIRSLGLRHYSGKFIILNKGPINAFVGFLEAFGEIARTISFTFRLFGNMFAGEILLVVMAFLLPLIGIIPFLGLELFVGLIQAFIFAMLTLVFGVMASISHGDGEHAEEH